MYFLALFSLEWDVVGGQKRPSLSGSGSGQAVVTGSRGLWGSMGHFLCPGLGSGYMGVLALGKFIDPHTRE